MHMKPIILLCLAFSSFNIYAQNISIPGERDILNHPEEIRNYVENQNNEVKFLLKRYDEFDLDRFMHEINDDLTNYLEDKPNIIRDEQEFIARILLNKQNFSISLNLKKEVTAAWYWNGPYYEGSIRMTDYLQTEDIPNYTFTFEHSDLGISETNNLLHLTSLMEKHLEDINAKERTYYIHYFFEAMLKDVKTKFLDKIKSLIDNKERVLRARSWSMSANERGESFIPKSSNQKIKESTKSSVYID